MTEPVQPDENMPLLDDEIQAVDMYDVPSPSMPVLPEFDEDEEEESAPVEIPAEPSIDFPMLESMEESAQMSETNVANESQPMVDATYRVRLPASQSPVNIGNLGGVASRTPSIPGVGTSASYAACVEHLRNLSEDATADNFKVHIRRRGPASFNGFRLPTGVIEETEPMPFDDIQARVAELHGGGTYNLQVITPSGQLSRQMMFRVDENMHEPKVPANAVPLNTLQPSEFGRMVRPQMNVGASGFGTHTAEDQIMIDLRKQEQILAATKQKEEREYEIEKSRRRRKSEEESEREAEERKKMLPEITEANRRVETLKDEIRHMADSFKDSIRELANSKNSKGDDESLKLLIESMKLSSDQQQKAQQRQTELQVAQMKQQSDMMIALIASMNKEKPHDNSIIEAIKMSVESSKQTTQMIMESAKNENSVMRDLFTSVVTQRLSAPDDQVKMHQQAEDRGWTKAMELTRLLEEARSGSDDGIEIDPDGGFWGNVSNIALQGIQRAIRGASQGGGLRGALQNALSPMTGYQQQQDAVQVPVHYQPQPQPQPQPMARPVQQLPGIVHHTPTPVLQSPNPEVQSSPLFEGVVEDGPSSVVTPSPVSVPVLPAPVQQQQQQATGGEEEEYDLRMHVTEAMRMALDDFKVGRKVHDWSDHAIDKWHRQFKVELAQAPDDAARIQLIGGKCEPAVYEQVINRIRGGGQDVFYFTQAIQAVVQDVAKEFAA
jgi:hypothetical protein